MQLCRTYEAQVAPAISRASPGRPAAGQRWALPRVDDRAAQNRRVRHAPIRSCRKMRSIADEFDSGDKAGTRCLAGFEQWPTPSGSGRT